MHRILVVVALTVSAAGPSGCRRDCPPIVAVPPPPAASDERMLSDVPTLQVAPARYALLMSRLPAPSDAAFENLLYEGNNPGMRRVGAPPSGASLAERWRVAARRARGVFVLRDSLFGQQDHPFRHDPFATMLPASWVTVAVAEVLAGRVPQRVAAPALEQDGAWRTIARPVDLFGSFPPSSLLFQHATRSLCAVTGAERAAVLNARRTLRQLADAADAMIGAVALGARAVAEAGAEAVAASDIRYFGADLRRRRVIPILVVNPTAVEIREGKGLIPDGRRGLEAAAALVADAILRRRLRDGDVAVERFDLRRPEERVRALALLGRLVPRGGETGASLWLWTHTADLDAREWSVAEATTRLAAFRDELAKAPIDATRVGVVHKPDLALAGEVAARPRLVLALDGFAPLRTLLSVDLAPAAVGAVVSGDDRAGR